jgi:hypothetical protein
MVNELFNSLDVIDARESSPIALEANLGPCPINRISEDQYHLQLWEQVPDMCHVLSVQNRITWRDFAPQFSGATIEQ